jgi:hypothetical protein
MRAGFGRPAPNSQPMYKEARRTTLAVIAVLAGCAAVGAEAADPLFKQPYVDIDEWRDKPVRHRYVHGGFTGTQARFSFYFPPKDRYQGRFFQHITPVPSNENLAQRASGEDDKLGFSIASGGYFVETNGGSLSAIAGDQTIPGYRVNRASAEYSRTLAAQMYGPHRPYGYAYGGSGGGYKTIAGFENTDTWDGAVPYVIGSPMAIPNVFTVRLLALRTLKDKFASIADAVEPGGSGDMYQGLDAEQKAALREVTQMGFPPQGWFNYKTIGPGAFPVLFGMVRMLDRPYFTDFWKVPGYAGANPPESLRQARIQHKASVTKILAAGAPETKEAFGGVDTAWQQLKADAPVGLQLDSVPSGSVEGAFLLVQSGEAAGKDVPIGRLVGNTVFAAVNPLGGDHSQVLNALKPGDQVRIDNSDFLAAQYYHRHQVPTPDFYVWDQFRGPDGKPLYPQRRMLLGPMVTGTGTVQSGRFKGKMIVCESLMDQDAFPWQADWYRTKVKAALGDRLDDNFRLWFTEHAVHSDDQRQDDNTHTVSYLGVLHQALRDVSAWVEKGVAPPASTSYKVADGQVQVPATAAGRKGIQPVVTLSVNGRTRAGVAVGKRVRFSAVIDVPANTGRLISAEWSLEGTGEFTPAKLGANPGARVNLTATHAFSKPGTYFPMLRVASQREGDAQTPYARIRNLGRVRVVVR